MIQKLLFKVANIIKREKVKPTVMLNPSISEPTFIQAQPTAIIVNDVPEHTQTRCKTCVGCGFIKTKSIICDVCNGNKCMMCNSLGLIQLPWSECTICYGSGEIRRSM